jgi:UPF0755 protein
VVFDRILLIMMPFEETGIRIIRNAALIAAAFAVLAGMYCVFNLGFPLAPMDEPVTVEISRGMNFMQVTGVLFGRRLVRDPNLFVALGRLTGLHRRIAPGRYRFQGTVSPWGVYRAVKNGDVIPWKVTVLEGDTLEDIRRKLNEEGLIDPARFDKLTRDEDFMEKMEIDSPSIEGYLYPDTYRLTKGLSEEEILTLMIRRLREKYDKRLVERTRALGLDERRVLTLASIIEKEAVVDNERPLISAVYSNRLKKGRRLQADPTAVYGIKHVSDGITREDLKRRTPYNTYRISGLPPGPIASPGIKSIEAALYPADASYMYFVSNNDGTHTFSVTHREHINAVRRYRKIREMAGK